MTMREYCMLKDSAAGSTAVMVEVEVVMDGWEQYFDQKMNYL